MVIMTHPSFFSSSCLRGSLKIPYPHKQPAQARKMWNPVIKWSLLGGWRCLTATAVLPWLNSAACIGCIFSNRHQPPLTNRLPPPAPLTKPPEDFVPARYPKPCPAWVPVSCEQVKAATTLRAPHLLI